MNRSPVFVMSVAPRCGSTWLQRIITAHGTLVWGEYMIELYYNSVKKWQHWTIDTPDKTESDLHAFRKNGPNMWMAVLSPTMSAFNESTRVYFDSLFGQSAREEGYDRWGSKLCRWSPDLSLWLDEVYPDCAQIFLIRDFYAAFRSHFNSGTNYPDMVYQINLHCQRWIENTKFAITQKKHPVVVYEDMITRYGAISQTLMSIGIIPLEEDVLKEKIGGKIGSSVYSDFTEEQIAVIDQYRPEINDLLLQLKERE